MTEVENKSTYGQFKIANINEDMFGNIKIYYDGGPKAHDNSNFSTTLNISTAALAINNISVLNPGSMAWGNNGIIDEVRVSNIERPAEWVKFEYYNMVSTAGQLQWDTEASAVTKLEDLVFQ